MRPVFELRGSSAVVYSIRNDSLLEFSWKSGKGLGVRAERSLSRCNPVRDFGSVYRVSRRTREQRFGHDVDRLRK